MCEITNYKYTGTKAHKQQKSGTVADALLTLFTFILYCSTWQMQIVSCINGF